MEKLLIYDLKDDPTVKRFLRKKSGLKISTIDGYLSALLSFYNFTGKSPTELHDIHKNDLRNRAAEFDQWLCDALDDYISFLIESGYTYGTINNYINHIKGFLHAFKLRPTPTTTISKKNILEDAKYALDRNDIVKAIKYSNPTYQTVFITQAQTGLSISDVLLLNIEDFISAVSKKDEKLSIKQAIYRAKSDKNLIGCFDLRRKKTGREFYTFAGPEVLRSIAFLLESRKKDYLEPDYPIFLKDISRQPLSKRNQLDLRLTPRGAIDYVQRMHYEKHIFPQIEVDGVKRNYFRTHKLRKWFSNQLRFRAGFTMDDTKYLMGQKTGDVLEHYINPNNYHALKSNYIKALPYLAINEDIVIEENNEAIEKLANENLELKKSIKDQRHTNINLIEEMKRLNRRMDLIEKLDNDEEYNERHP